MEQRDYLASVRNLNAFVPLGEQRSSPSAHHHYYHQESNQLKRTPIKMKSLRGNSSTILSYLRYAIQFIFPLGIIGVAIPLIYYTSHNLIATKVPKSSTEEVKVSYTHYEGYRDPTKPDTGTWRVFTMTYDPLSEHLSNTDRVSTLLATGVLALLHNEVIVALLAKRGMRGTSDRKVRQRSCLGISDPDNIS